MRSRGWDSTSCDTTLSRAEVTGVTGGPYHYNTKEAPVEGAQAGVPLPGLAAVQAHTPLPPVDSAGEVNIILCHVMLSFLILCFAML